MYVYDYKEAILINNRMCSTYIYTQIECVLLLQYVYLEFQRCLNFLFVLRVCFSRLLVFSVAAKMFPFSFDFPGGVLFRFVRMSDNPSVVTPFISPSIGTRARTAQSAFHRANAR